MRPPFALAPTFMPYRPQGDGWVAYHGAERVTGVPGLAMTWRGPDGGLRYAAILGRQNDGQVTASGRLGEGQDVTEVLSESLRGRPGTTPEATLFALLLPHEGSGSDRAAPAGLPPFGERVDLARRAVAEAGLPPAMRAAFEACLTHGYPASVPLCDLRRKTFSPLWPALALAAAHPGLGWLVLASQPQILTEADPMAAVRDRWRGLTDAHLRRMRGPDGPPTTGAKPGGDAARASLDLLSGCPVDWWPAAGAWPAFVACAQTLQAIRYNGPGGGAMLPFAVASKGDWTAFAERLRRAAGIGAGPRDGGDLLNRARDCIDPLMSLSHAVILPLVAGRSDGEAIAGLDRYLSSRSPSTEPGEGKMARAAAESAWHLLYGGRSAVAILETSAAWHARRAGMQAEIRGEGGAAAWPPLFEGVFRDGDVGIVSLLDYAGLRDEGGAGVDTDGVTGLDHCVATRLGECLLGRAHVLSVRLYAADGAWGRLATCEVSARRTEDGRARITVSEHRGRENAEPDPAAVAAVARLSKAIETGLVAVTEEALSERREGYGLALRCGYDWRDPDAVANAVRTWRPFLPRWARELEPDELHEALVERGLLPEPEAAVAPGPALP